MGSQRRRDFPVSFRGYERAAVDAHVAALAGEVERLRAELERARLTEAAEPQVPTVAAATGQQVEVVIAAAQQAAADIEREATRSAREQVGSVGVATDSLLSSVEAMEGELDGLLAQLRAAGARIQGELGAAAAGIDRLHEALPEGTAAPAQAELEPAHHETTAVELPAPDATPSAAPAQIELEQGTLPAAPGEETGDIDHARLVAVNMALSGEPREHTERRLREELGVSDPAPLVADVYAALGS